MEHQSEILMEHQIEILLDGKDLVLRPGDMLRGGWRLNAAYALPVKKAELFVLWFTEGLGDTDDGTLFHQVAVENAALDAGRAFPFETPLPPGPWTYDGKYVKIRWAVRVFITPQSGKAFGAEERFQLLPRGRQGGAPMERNEPPEPQFGATA